MFKFLQIYDFIINPNNINFVEYTSDDEGAGKSTIYIHFNNGETKIISLKDYQECCDVLEALNKCITTKNITVNEV